MKLRIEHTTIFTYDSPISEAYTEMRLAPLDVDGQRRVTFRLDTDPSGAITHYKDRYDNEVHYFDVLQPHQQLRVSVLSEVYTSENFADDSTALSPLDEFDYLRPTEYTPHHEIFQPLTKARQVTDDPALLMNAVYQALTYEKGATNVKTTADEALQIGKGVCQDFAHVMIAAARSLGLPARYVSGYLYSPDAPEMASHAWVDVFVPARGWVALDPTHNCLQSAKHVRVGVGRDYADVPPTRGVYKGNAKEKMEIQVSVQAL